jgi:hypothetical protein
MRTELTGARIACLLCLFFLIAWGLGYPTLNRYDPRQTSGLSDVRTYVALVTGTSALETGHMRFRVLIPWIARPFFHLANGRLGSWNPAMFGLLVTDSLFVAATALLIVVLGTRLALGTRQVDRYAVSLVGSLLYLLNFAVSNLRVTGEVDAGEGFFLLALLWSLSELRLWALPLIALLGALSKETFVPFSIVFMAAWWLVARESLASPVRSLIWIIASSAVSLMTTVALQWWIVGHFVGPVEFAAGLHGNHDYLRHFMFSLWDQNFWYIFLWLLPAAIPNLKAFPKSWLIPTAAASGAAFVLDGYYGGAPGTVGRALFSVAGPLLSLSAAAFLLGELTDH